MLMDAVENPVINDTVPVATDVKVTGISYSTSGTDLCNTVGSFGRSHMN